MRRISPISRRFRYQLQAFDGIPIINNWWLRRLLYLLRRISCLLTCDGTVLERTQTVTTDLTLVREEDLFAKKTILFNEGSERATVLEDGVIVGFVEAGASSRLPLSGRLELKALTDASTTSLRIVTFRRCLCGDALPPYDATSISVSDVTTVFITDYPQDENVWELTGGWIGNKANMQIWGRYEPFGIAIYADEERTISHLILFQDEGFGLPNSTTAHSISFALNGAVFTGTIRKNKNQRSVSPFSLYLDFSIKRLAADLI